MNRYVVTIRWRSFRWELEGVAPCSADLVAGLVDYFGPGAYIAVRCA